MTLKEVNNIIQEIDNKIEYYLQLKELALDKILPAAIDTTKVMVDGGKRADRYANYYLSVEKYDNELEKLYKEKRINEEYLDNELRRLDKYDEIARLIVYYKEETFEKLSWWQISQRVHYSESQCRRIYRRIKRERNLRWTLMNTFFRYN